MIDDNLVGKKAKVLVRVLLEVPNSVVQGGSFLVNAVHFRFSGSFGLICSRLSEA